MKVKEHGKDTTTPRTLGHEKCSENVSKTELKLVEQIHMNALCVCDFQRVKQEFL